MSHNRVCGKTRILSRHVCKLNRDALRPPLRKTPGLVKPPYPCQKIVASVRYSVLSRNAVKRQRNTVRLHNPCNRSKRLLFNDPRNLWSSNA